MTHRFDRTMLLETDPARMGTPQLTSLRDADVRHQQAAMVAGYNSLAEMAIDELIVMVRELEERVTRLERQLGHAIVDMGEIVP